MKKKDPPKKKGGWFSCFSSAADDRNVDFEKKGKMQVQHRNKDVDQYNKDVGNMGMGTPQNQMAQ